MKKLLIIIPIFYVSCILTMEHAHLLEQLTKSDVETLEDIVRAGSGAHEKQFKEFRETVERIKTIEHLRKNSEFGKLLDYGNTEFIQKPHVISFIPAIIKDLEQSDNQDLVYETWNSRKKTLLNESRRQKEITTGEVELLCTTESQLSEPRLRHIIAFAEEIARRAANNYDCLVKFDQQLNDTE